MSSKQQRNLGYVLALVSIGGILFNIIQAIIIINGKYNRNPNIDSKFLQILDSVALTGLWLLLSAVVLYIAFRILRQNK